MASESVTDKNGKVSQIKKFIPIDYEKVSVETLGAVHSTTSFDSTRQANVTFVDNK